MAAAIAAALKPMKERLGATIVAMQRTIASLRHFRNIATYLAARMAYNDGKTAVLVFGGVYAVGILTLMRVPEPAEPV